MFVASGAVIAPSTNPPATSAKPLLGLGQNNNSVGDVRLYTLELSETADLRDACNDDIGAHGTGNPRTKILILILLLCVITFVIVDSFTGHHIIDGFNVFLDWIQENPYVGALSFVGVYIVATVCFMPGSVLTIGAGFVFGRVFGIGRGLLLATLTVMFGASGGAIVAFLLGRYLLRDFVTSLAEKYPMMKALDLAVQQNGLKIFMLLRLSVNIPFNALNYISGATSIDLMKYTLSLLAMIPGTTLYCFIGATASSLGGESEVSGSWSAFLIVLSVILDVLVVIAVSHYTRKELNRIMATQTERQNLSVSEETSEDRDRLNLD